MLVGGEAHGDGEVGADGGADGLVDLTQQPHAVFEAAAVLVGALVLVKGHEAGDEVAVARVDLHAIKAGLLGVGGGDAELAHQLLDFLDGGLPGHISVPGAGHGGDGHRLHATIDVAVGLTAGVVDLAEDFAAVLVDGVGHLLVAGDLRVLIETSHILVSGGIAVDAVVLGDDQAKAALGLGFVIADVLLRGIALRGTHISDHGGDCKAVGDFAGADFQRGE